MMHLQTETYIIRIYNIVCCYVFVNITRKVNPIKASELRLRPENIHASRRKDERKQKKKKKKKESSEADQRIQDKCR